MSGLWEVFPKACLAGILRSGGCGVKACSQVETKYRISSPSVFLTNFVHARNLRHEIVSAEIRAVGAAKAAECASAIDALVAQIERHGFVARSAGKPSTENPFCEDAERVSEEAASRIRGVLYAVWSRGWDKADGELAGGPPGE